MEMSQGTIRALLEAFDQSDWLEMTVTVGNDSLRVSRRVGTDLSGPATTSPLVHAGSDGARSQAAGGNGPGPARTEEPASEPLEDPPPNRRDELPPGAVIESPCVGLFWRAPSPGAPPFVETGQAVSEGDTLAIVEVMKLMNHVVAPVGGVVAAIVPENGEQVEHHQPLVVIDPEG
jgi:acetyl-CoA carboxylase biotin carboxyl carrier protein